MNTLSHKPNRTPHQLITRKYAVKLAIEGLDTDVIIRRYKISRSSLWRWRKRFDGTDASLVDRSHRPRSRHPNAHTDEELKWIRDLRRRNPKYSYLELWIRLKHSKGYHRHPCSLYRLLVRDLDYKQAPKATYVPKPYDTPTQVGIKWQIDTKYVPITCRAPRLIDKKFYQYTIIDECSRKRFLAWYDEPSAIYTLDFIIKAIDYFGYKPQTLQSDNGFEFTNTNRQSLHKTHPCTKLCQQLNITHQLIRPRTPRHNGKVERSHRTDNEKFYDSLKFYSLDDLRRQGKIWLKRYNEMPKAILGYRSPNEIERIKLAELA